MRCPDRVGLALLAATLWLAAAVAAAQSSGADAGRDAQKWEVRAAATEQDLWVTQIGPKSSRLYHRTASRPFDRGRLIPRRIALLAAADDNAYVVFEDDTLFRYSDDVTDPGHPSLILPEHERPLDLLGARGKLYALVSSKAAARLTRAVPTASEPAASAPFEPGDAPLSVVSYDGRDWTAIAPCPTGVVAADTPRLGPKLCLTAGQLALFWLADATANQIQYARLDVDSGRWHSGGTIGVARLTAFWVVLGNRTPTLVVATRPDDGVETLGAYRFLGSLDGGRPGDWQRAELRFAPPERFAPTRYEVAFGFNQHVGFVAADTVGEPHLGFAGIGADPLEPTIRLADLPVRTEAVVTDSRAFQLFMLLILVLVFTGLFVFRRSSMVTAIELPGGWRHAFAFQRLIGWVIDLVPFTLAWALILKLPWADAFRQAAIWAVGTDTASAGLRATSVALWWGASTASYTTYCLIMELLVGRTVGKVLTGIHLLAEAGRPPTRLQLVTRNVLRLIELLPPLWVLGFLVVLTRNRQRLGDIFARTIAVRAVPPNGPSRTRAPDERRSQDESHEPDEPGDKPEAPSDGDQG